jgi:hypothetical protein
LPIYIEPSAFEPPSRQTPVWSSGPVRVDGDDLVLDRDSATTYLVADKLEIHLRFAAIKDIHEAARFATEFGLLYHGALPRGTVPDAVTADLLRWHDEDEVRDPREPYAEWMPEVARINKILRVYRLVSGPRWGEQEFEDLLELYHKWIRTDLRGAPAPKDQQEAIYLGALYVCRMTNDWFDRTRTILDLDLQAADEGQVARPAFDLAMESPITLLGYIYFRLAQDFSRAARFGRCPGCGTIFKTEKGDRRTYDTPQCSQRTRYHKYASRNPGYRRKAAEPS